MKKVSIFIGFLGILLILGAFSESLSARAQEIRWTRGMKGKEIETLQEILKEDPTIYPEGYVTGYFGPLTEGAIRRLQRKCGISETGIVDNATEKCIYPVGYKVRVISPNGGEVWNKNEIQAIKWEVIWPTGEETIPQIKPYPFWSKASIDLFREIEVGPAEHKTGEVSPSSPTEEKRVFVKHIATVNLFDKAYSWKIPGDVKNGEGYIIRISLGKGINPIIMGESVGAKLQEIWPEPPRPVPPVNYIYWDESDGPFEITGSIVPDPGPIPDLTKVIAILEEMIVELQKAIALLKGISN